MDELFAQIRKHMTEVRGEVDEYLRLELEYEAYAAKRRFITDNGYDGSEGKRKASSKLPFAELPEAELILNAWDKDYQAAVAEMVRQQEDRIGCMPITLDNVLEWTEEELAQAVAKALPKSTFPRDITDHLSYGAWDYFNTAGDTVYKMQFLGMLDAIQTYVVDAALEAEALERDWLIKLELRTNQVNNEWAQAMELKHSCQAIAQQMQDILDRGGPHFLGMLVAARGRKTPVTSPPEQPKKKERKPKLPVVEAKKQAAKVVEVESEPDENVLALEQAGRQGYVSPWYKAFVGAALRAGFSVGKDPGDVRLEVVHGKRPGMKIEHRGQSTLIRNRKGWEKEVNSLAARWL